MGHEALPGHTCNLPSFNLRPVWSVVRIPVSPHTFRCWEGLGDGFGVVCHHPACTGAFPGCKLLPSKESPSVLGDGVIPFRGVV